MHRMVRAFSLSVAFGLPMVSIQAQSPAEKVDLEIVNKIKDEGLQRSKVMDTISYLTDVYGPRLTGAPKTKVAGEWTVSKLTEWGLQNAHLEPWGPFGRGWELESSSINMVEPSFSPLIAYPKAWSPSTQTKVRGVPIYLNATTEEELEKFRGKLGRAIVLLSPPREVKAWFEPPATRQTIEQLLGMANAEAPVARGMRGGRGGPGGPSRNVPTGSAGGPPASGQPADAVQRTGAPENRSAFQLQTDKWQLAFDEGAAVVLEPGRGDGGTVFVASATMPRQASAERPAEGGNPFARGPRPWSVDAPQTLPQAVLAVEHYNRLIRMIERGAAPTLEVDISCKFFADDVNSFNVIAEIPGTDLKDEIVMLGGHFDSWHSGTGATDNAAGCGVALEAVRILQAIEAKPRRTIRIALWTGEEQGLFGSRAYVADHFGKTVQPTRGPGEGGGEGAEGRRERPTPKYELLPEHEKLSAYYNLDNGTGKIRGVYMQGNEQVRSIFRAWLAPFSDMDASTLTLSNTGGTDHLSFDGIGLPGFQFIQDPLEYDTRTHHSSMDVYERIQEEDMKQASIIMASFVYHTAMRDEKLPRKPLDGEIVKPETATPVIPPVAVPAPAEAAAAANQ